MKGKFFSLDTINRLSLSQILVLAAIVRIIAAIFSRGYGMYDDHFLVIEVAQNWIEGGNIFNWMPGAKPDISHNLFYAGIHYYILLGMKAAGLQDPQTKMLLIRLVHAFYSLLTVYFAYKITERLSNSLYAKCAALLLALLWFMPNLSVRNLVEMACIPPLLASSWWLIKNEKPAWKDFFIAGFLVGFAFSFRYQTILFAGGAGLVLLFQQQWKGALVYGLAFLLNVFLFQCVADIILWGYPLAEFKGYIDYNILHKGDYITGYWFNYALLISGLVLPPFCLLLWFTYFRNYRNTLLLFVPSFIFLAFHSSFENKQERFILPFIPYLIILGFAGFQYIEAYLRKNNGLAKAVKYSTLFATGVNMLLLVVFSVSSTKTSSMDAMGYLRQQGDATGIVLQSEKQNWPAIPQFYLGKWVKEYYAGPSHDISEELKNAAVPPNYIIFISPDELDARVQKFKEIKPDITLVATIQPSFIDWLFHKLNPVNKNETYFIYRINS